MISKLLHALVAHPKVYDFVQWAVGMRHTRNELAKHYHQIGASSVLDIGAGTGLYVAAMPPEARYFWLDYDRQKLQGFQSRVLSSVPALLGDATSLGIADKSVDYSTCVMVAHHLDDEQIKNMVVELARVTRRKIILLDPLATPAITSRLLWRYDRGSFPRTATQLCKYFETHFIVEYTKKYRVYHEYLIIVAAPR